MSWDVDREEWEAAAKTAPTREPLRSVLDEVDGRLCGMLGFDLSPPPPGAVSEEVPTIHSTEIIAGPEPEPEAASEPRTGDEPLDVRVSPVSASGQVGEALEVELQPGEAPAEVGALPEPHPTGGASGEAGPDVAVEPEPEPEPEPEAEAEAEAEPEPAPEADPAAEPEQEPPTESEPQLATAAPVLVHEDDDDEGVQVRPGVPAAIEAVTESGQVAAAAHSAGEVEAQAQAVVAAGPPPTESSPSLFMPASLLRPAEELEEPPLEEPPPEEAAELVGDAHAVPEPVEVLPSEELEAEDVEEAEVLDSADLLDAAVEQPPEPPPASHAPAAPHAGPPKPPPSRRRNWFDDVFTEHFATLSPEGVEESAIRDVEFILSVAEPAEQATVLDIGCGIGYHSLKLAELGFRVTGVDFSLAQLLRASELNEERQGGVSFMHGDMRGLPTEDEFDLVLCVGSTLGYFEEDTNRQTLEEMRDRVKPGGRLVLQVFNRDYLVSKLPIRSWWQGNKCLVLDEAELNYKANRLRVHRTIVFEDGRQFEHYMFLRAYSVHDLGKFLSSLGLKVISLSGSRETRGRFYGSASPDIWIVAERRVKE